MKAWAQFEGGPYHGRRLWLDTDQLTVHVREESPIKTWQPGPLTPLAVAPRVGAYFRKARSSSGSYRTRAYYEWQGWQ